MVDSQSPWRLSIIPEIFWGIINFIVLFFRTLISPSMTKHGNSYTSDYRSGGQRPHPHPRRRMGGFRGGGGGAPQSPTNGRRMRKVDIQRSCDTESRPDWLSGFYIFKGISLS